MRFYLRALSYFRDDLGKVIASQLLIALSTIFGLLTPFPLAILIGPVFTGDHSGQWVYRVYFHLFPTQNKTSQVLILTAITLGLVIVQEVLKFVQTLLNIVVGYDGLMTVRCELFRKLQELSLSYHRSVPQGDAIYRLIWDTFGFQTILNVASGVLLNAVTLVAMTCILFAMNWQLALISLAIVPPLLWTIRHYSKVLNERSILAKEVDTKLTTAVQRSVATIGLVQAFGREADEYLQFHTTVRSMVAAYLRLHWQEVMYWLVLGLIFGTGGALIFGYGGYLAVYGRQGMKPELLIVFLDYMRRMYDPLNKLSSTGAAIQGGVAGAQRVFEVLDRDPIIFDAPGAMELPRLPRTLQLDHIWFEYREGAPVLRDVDVTIQPGETVAFVGSSGVGKTTLLNLLPRFYDPTQGALRLDSHDLRTIKLRDIRRHIALVLQDNVVLPTSVRENIAYGRPEATTAQIRESAELAGAIGFIDKLPEGLETQISESGSNLSGGQKQRISIARALLTEAPIIIMDEPTSALDPQHEHLIIETLKGLRGKRTIILVSHRLSTVADCDQIFVMDEGRIVERGNHAQLVARRGLYFSMAKHQMKLPDAGEVSAEAEPPGAAGPRATAIPAVIPIPPVAEIVHD